MSFTERIDSLEVKFWATPLKGTGVMLNMQVEVRTPAGNAHASCRIDRVCKDPDLLAAQLIKQGRRIPAVTVVTPSGTATKSIPASAVDGNPFRIANTILDELKDLFRDS